MSKKQEHRILRSVELCPQPKDGKKICHICKTSNDFSYCKLDVVYKPHGSRNETWRTHEELFDSLWGDLKDVKMCPECEKDPVYILSRLARCSTST